MNIEMEAEPSGEQLEVSRVVLQYADLNKEEWTENQKDQDKYIDMLESRLREVEEKERGEVSRREQQELQEIAAQIAELKATEEPSSAQYKLSPHQHPSDEKSENHNFLQKSYLFR